MLKIESHICDTVDWTNSSDECYFSFLVIIIRDASGDIITLHKKNYDSDFKQQIYHENL